MAKKKLLHKSKKVQRARRKNHSWRILKMKSSIKRNLRLLGLAVIVFISTLVVFAAVSFYNFYRRPLAAAGGVLPKTTWTEEGRENLLLVLLDNFSASGAPSVGANTPIRGLAVLSLDPWEKGATLLLLPLEVEVEVPGGLGLARLSMVYALGEMSSPPQSINLLLKTVANFLSVPLDGYLLLDRSGLAELENVLGEKASLESFKALLSPLKVSHWPRLLGLLSGSLRTNLNLEELGKAGWFFSGVRFDKATTVSLDESLASSLEARHLFIKRLFLEQKVREENLKVLILNGTEVSGLAGKASLFVETLGGEVLNVGNAPSQDYKKSLMIVKETSSYTVRRLRDVFSFGEVRLLENLTGEADFSFFARTDVVLILGLDKASEL